MKFLTSLLLLVATTCFGAVPDYKAFRGTGGITITSNPPIGTIVIDGSGISSPTGGVSAATATNISQYFSTNSAVVTSNYFYGVQQDLTAASTNGNYWNIWLGAATNYFAINRVAGLYLTSNDFGGLLQNVVNIARHGAYIHITGNPYFSGQYVISNKVTMTNFAVIQGDGNPATVLHAASTLNEPMIEVGTASVPTTGINKFSYIRFEGADGGASCVGLKFVNSAEPVLEFCEWTGFKFAGVQISQTTANHWSYMQNCWFVVNNGGAGVLIDSTPSLEQDQELFIADSMFGIGQGKGIVVSNKFGNISIQSSRFRFLSPFDNSSLGIQLYAGVNYTIANNRFLDWPLQTSPIRFENRPAPTNYNSLVIGNVASGLPAGPATNVVYVGVNVQGVSLLGNYIPSGTGYVLGGTNASPLLVDRNQMLVSNLPGSGSILAVDSTGSYYRTNFNFFNAGISNIVAADGIAIGTNGGLLWITNTVTGAGSGNVSSNNAGGITAIGLSTNKTDLRVEGDLFANGFFDNNFAGDFVLLSDPTGEIVESTITSAEAFTLTGIGTVAIITQLSNKVRVAAGANIGVTASGSGGIMTYTVDASSIGVASSNLSYTIGANATTYVNTVTVAITNALLGKVDELDGVFTNLTGRGLTLPSLTASRPLILNASGNATNATGTPDGTKFLRDDGTLATPAGAGDVTTAQLNTASNEVVRLGSNNVRVAAGTGISVASAGSGGVQTYTVTATGSGGGGTNYPPVITIGTNITVGVGVRQSVTLSTNASFRWHYTGTPLNGEEVDLSVSNYSASVIYGTNTAFNTQVGSNDTIWAFPPLSVRKMKFVSSTNNNLGVARWELQNNLQKEAELAAGSGTTLSTNADGSIISINLSTAPSVAGLTITNNLSYRYSTSDFVATNDTANSNLSVVFGSAGTGTREIYLTNNISLTNYSGFAAGVNSSVKWRVIPTGMNRTVVWPVAAASSFGMRFDTNAGSILWTTFTNGSQYLVSWDSWNTNLLVTVAAFSSP